MLDVVSECAHMNDWKKLKGWKVTAFIRVFNYCPQGMFFKNYENTSRPQEI
jgi:hypothetical protein